MDDLEQLIKKIAEEAGVDENEVRERIEEKKTELSGLISDEGAAHIVAKELGIPLIKRMEKKLNLENVIPGMRNVDVVGRVTKISPIREFKTDNAEGKVCNIRIADATGSVRVSLWNDEIDKIKDIKEGDVVRVRGYVREDNWGNPEIRLGHYGSIQLSQEEMPSLDELMDVKQIERACIRDLKEGQWKEIRGALLHVFETNPFYEVCPECKKRLKQENGKFLCDEHGEVEPNFSIVLSGIVDDGTGNMRIVLFGSQAESLIGMTVNEAREIYDRKKEVSSLLENVPLGKEFVFEGRVRKNEFFDRLEFIANNVKNVNVQEEISRLING